MHNGIMRGTRVGSGRAGEQDDRGYTVAKVVMLYHCANGHHTTVPFIWTATLPPQWECRVCSSPAGTDPLNPPPPVTPNDGENAHLASVKSRRSPAEGAALMAESLARRDHPEKFCVPAGPRRRPA